MFDISFTELLVIGIVALFVIGPKHLPATLRSVARWSSQLKRFITDTRQQLEDEIGLDQIRTKLDEDQAIKEITRTKMELTEILSDTNKELSETGHSAIGDPRHWPGMPPADSSEDHK